MRHPLRGVHDRCIAAEACDLRQEFLRRVIHVEGPTCGTAGLTVGDVGPMVDIERRRTTLLDVTRTVFESGRGPAVIVMSEMRGIYRHFVRFARTLRTAGFTECMSVLLGAATWEGPRGTAQRVDPCCTGRRSCLAVDARGGSCRFPAEPRSGRVSVPRPALSRCLPSPSPPTAW